VGDACVCCAGSGREVALGMEAAAAAAQAVHINAYMLCCRHVTAQGSTKEWVMVCVKSTEQSAQSARPPQLISAPADITTSL
jgi:hypothetical protein